MTLRDLSQEPQVIEFLLGHGVKEGQEYLTMRLKGESHNIAKICATRKSPALNTDTTFLSGHVNGSQFAGCPDVGRHHKAVAEAAGINTAGAVYMGGLARYSGDPEAWVSSKGDVARICTERGWGVEGAVTVQRREAAAMPDTLVGEDIVNEAATMFQAMHPDMSGAEARDKAIRLRSGASASDEPLRVAPVTGDALSESPDF